MQRLISNFSESLCANAKKGNPCFNTMIFLDQMPTLFTSAGNEKTHHCVIFRIKRNVSDAGL